MAELSMSSPSDNVLGGYPVASGGSNILWFGNLPIPPPILLSGHRDQLLVLQLSIP